jgi:TolB-like protein
MSAILNDYPPALTKTNRNIPARLQRIVERCLEKGAEDRFQSATELTLALEDSTPSSLEVRKTRGITKGRRASAGIINSIAVMPFDNVGDSMDADYLSDGITEAIINMLSQLPKLRVVPRSTVFRYRATPFDAVVAGRELNVRAVLVGRVSQRDESLVVGAELIDVEREAQLWGAQYNRRLTDIFAVQEEIAREISVKLSLSLSGADRGKLVRRQTENSEAYQLYLRGRYFLSRRTSDALRKAVQCFQQAVELDPQYALAYTALGEAYGLPALYNLSPPAEAMPRCRLTLSRALQLDDTLAEAHSLMGNIKYGWEWDWAGAEREYQRALELRPDLASPHQWYAMFLLAKGRIEESQTHFGRALEMEPLNMLLRFYATYPNYMTRKFDLAIDDLDEIVELEPNFPLSRAFLGLCHVFSGSHDKGIEELERAVKISGNLPLMVGYLGHAHAIAGRETEARRGLEQLASAPRYVPSLLISFILSALGEGNAAFEHVERAFQERDSWLPWAKLDTRFDVFRSNPRFQQLVETMHA